MLKSLCCMRLKRAGIVIGWLSFIGSLVATVIFLVLLFRANVLFDFDVEPYTDNFSGSNWPHYTMEAQHAMNYSISMGIALFQAVASVMLILGTHKNRHLILMPWLVNAIIFIISLSLAVLFKISCLLYSPVMEFILFIINIIILTIAVYIFYGIYSLYKEIQFSKVRPQISFISA